MSNCGRISIDVSQMEAGMSLGKADDFAQQLTVQSEILPVETSASQQDFPLVADKVEEIQVGIDTAVVAGGGTYYGGPYEVTPNKETQILQTSGRVMSNNVRINPIPSNYGLITWNGSALTVS